MLSGAETSLIIFFAYFIILIAFQVIIMLEDLKISDVTKIYITIAVIIVISYGVTALYDKYSQDIIDVITNILNYGKTGSSISNITFSERALLFVCIPLAFITLMTLVFFVLSGNRVNKITIAHFALICGLSLSIAIHIIRKYIGYIKTIMLSAIPVTIFACLVFIFLSDTRRK
jgi:hypothetical protein